VSDVGATSFSQHQYVTKHRFDRNGRRTVLKLPAQLVTGGQDSIRYTYAFWGNQLEQVWDPQGNLYAYSYNVRDEPTQLYSVFGAMSHHWRYDEDGRLSVDSVSVTGGGFPYFPFAIARRSALRYDGRAKLTGISGSFGSKDTVVNTYSGLGSLKASAAVQRGIGVQNGDSARHRSLESVSYDGLGHITGRGAIDSILKWAGGSPSLLVDSDSSWVVYVAGVGRDTLDFPVSQGPRRIHYDSAGNVVFTMKTAGSQSQAQEDRASYYDAAGRLFAADARYMSNDQQSYTTRVLEEYRYDALGRRVWVRARKTCSVGQGFVPPPVCLAAYIRRTIWDGDQELAEIQVPGNQNQSAYHEVDVGTINLPYIDNADVNPFYGRVIYTHGLLLDRPIAVARYSLVDLPAGGSYTTWPDFVVEPSWDARGTLAFGSYGGYAYKQLVPGGTQCVAVPATSPQRCLRWGWPGARAAYNSQLGVIHDSWLGTLLEDKIDGAGTYYRRNRQYDPTRGRFTQEDPIGLAGGLNLYGFANSDPVNFSDPFGLCPERDPNCKEFTGAEARAVFARLAAMPIAEAILESGKLTATLAAPGLGGGGAGISTLRIGGARMLGHYPAYVIEAGKTGAKIFSMPSKVYEAMSVGERWATNAKFLDRGISAGAEFQLATPATAIRRGSTLAREVQYLLDRGYAWSSDFSKLVPK